MFIILVIRCSRTSCWSLSSRTKSATSSTEHSPSAQSAADFKIESVSASLKMMKRAEEETAGCGAPEEKNTVSKKYSQGTLHLLHEQTYGAGLESWERGGKGIGSSQEKSDGKKAEHCQVYFLLGLFLDSIAKYFDLWEIN